MSLIGKDTLRYVDTSLVLDVVEIIKYGYNNHNLVALVEERHGAIYYISCKRKIVHGEKYIGVQIFSEDDFVVSPNMQWVAVKKNDINNKLQHRKNLILLFFIQLIIVVFTLIFTLVNFRNSNIAWNK